MALQGGIDEAGRGPVMGPLVVAGVLADPEHLQQYGVKDSKKLTAKRREHIARLLEEDGDVQIFVDVVAPEELDALMANQTLNAIELARFQGLAARLADAGAEAITVDAADVNAERFGNHIQAAVPEKLPVHSMHRADDHDPVTAAASIVAKVTRDQQIQTLAKRLERKMGYTMGSGYPSDPNTKLFLKAWVEKYGDLPEGTRRAWSTSKALLAPKQTALEL